MNLLNKNPTLVLVDSNTSRQTDLSGLSITMERWQDKVAVVTGASSGIGAAIAESLVQNGMKVVGLARREELLKELETRLKGQKGIFYGKQADLSNEEEILTAFQWIENNLGGVHVLVNNAGICKTQALAVQESEDWRQIYNINVLALQICCKETLKSMRAHNINNGHIINISSQAAHVSSPIPGIATYFASKKAVNAISEGLRIEIGAAKSDIRVTTISPGLVDTKVLETTVFQFPRQILDLALKPEDVAEAVIFVLQLKPHVLVSELLIQPVKDISDIIRSSMNRE